MEVTRTKKKYGQTSHNHKIKKKKNKRKKKQIERLRGMREEKRKMGEMGDREKSAVEGMCNHISVWETEGN